MVRYARLLKRGEEFLERWGLRQDGAPMSGRVSVVLPVVCGDGTRAALKLQDVDEETVGEGLALRTWGGDGVVRLLAEDAETGTLLLERLDEARPLAVVEDVIEATRILAGLLARLTAVPAPEGLRRLDGVVVGMFERLPAVLKSLEEEGADEADRRLLKDCAAAVGEVAGEPGDRLLHWDLHFENVLAAEREPWLVIDPKPLGGDPGFELLPALWNRFEEGRLARRFDLLTGVVGLERERARAWTLGRVLQNSLWRVEEGGGDGEALDAEQMAIARWLLGR
ncbi:aminoglycoside phosphotransferase family protein [Streptomyces sp. NBC_00878]|uniref:aminoglycoside phosphotransferase family protein n=1 Tax=Streptomyces sp. NBC_00878 TaxID=2975854 RepID=UPI00224FE143|nr:aminoglycoside phosphotransferase family protein [Streptomyces sp. NBC_00878]MCX4906639.1 aminoglycoside phosphotransferase family protein [Streptomyces sp. NBC_00878]